MGAKKLKALALAGSAKVQLADEESLNTVIGRVRKTIAEHPMAKREGVFPRIGAPTAKKLQDLGIER